MKYLKALIHGVVAAMLVMACAVASTASATELYSGATTLKSGTTIDASLSGSAFIQTTEGTILDTCAGGTIKGKITNAGSSTSTVTGNIEELTWTNCTEPTATIARGGLEFHYISGDNGTLTSITNPDTGEVTEFTVETTIFGTCVLTIPSGTTVGTITGTSSGNSTIDVNAVITRKSGLCPNTEKWNATYKVTEPVPFRVATS